jgi:hypothetical protein
LKITSAFGSFQKISESKNLWYWCFEKSTESKNFWYWVVEIFSRNQHKVS